MAGLKIAAFVDESRGQSRIESPAADAGCDVRQPLITSGPVSNVPADFSILRRALQHRSEPQARSRVLAQTGDELSANPVPRIISGLKDSHGNFFPSERESE